MPSADDGATAALIEAARIDFARSLTAKADALIAQTDGEAWEEARRAAHKLRGSAGVHGFAAVGATAAAVEELLLEVRERPDPSQRDRLRSLLIRLRDEAARATQDTP